MHVGGTFRLRNILGLFILAVNLSLGQDTSWSPVVSFTTGPPPILTVSGSFDFGNVAIGKSLTKHFTLTNGGAGLLVMTDITSSNPAFTVERGSMSISAYKTDSIGVTFKPDKNRSASSVITIQHNALGSPLKFGVSGRGVGGSGGKTNR